MKTCKANGAPVGALVDFNGRQMLVVDDSSIHAGTAITLKRVCTGRIATIKINYFASL